MQYRYLKTRFNFDIQFSAMPVTNAIINEFDFKTSRSAGKGGQHVNKVETRVEAIFHISGSDLLSEEEKSLLQEKLKNKVSAEGKVRVVCESSRSQSKNKEIATQKLLELLRQGLHKPRKRKATAPPKSVKEKRLADKKIAGEKKRLRKKPGL